MTLNIQGSMRINGLNYGLQTEDMGRLYQRFATAQKEFEEALSENVLPISLSEEQEERISMWATHLKREKQITIVCSPMVAEGLTTISTPYPVRWLTDLDDTVSEPSGLWIVLDAGPWIQGWLFEHCDVVLAGCSTMIYCSGDGSERTIPEGLRTEIVRIQEEGIADERFCLFSSLAMALYQSPTEAVKGLKRGLDYIIERDVWKSSSALLAVVTDGLTLSPHMETVWVPRSNMLSCVRWSEKLFHRMSSRHDAERGIPERIFTTNVVQLGDEGACNLPFVNPRHFAVVFREPASSQLKLQQSQQLERWLSQQSVATVVWELSSTWSIAQQVQFQVQWMHRTLIGVAMRGIDPLAYVGADNWRESSTNF